MERLDERKRITKWTSRSPARSLRDARPGIREGNGVGGVCARRRTRQESGIVPGHTGPFLRDELVKFIESVKLGENQHRPSSLLPPLRRPIPLFLFDRSVCSAYDPSADLRPYPLYFHGPRDRKRKRWIDPGTLARFSVNG